MRQMMILLTSLFTPLELHRVPLILTAGMVKLLWKRNYVPIVRNFSVAKYLIRKVPLKKN